MFSIRILECFRASSYLKTIKLLKKISISKKYLVSILLKCQGHGKQERWINSHRLKQTEKV